ncbi:MAG TPA: cell division FtsA domain-containing protein [Bacilli bacterium]|nr:cell division FtsA domain-containing protein [Bacilli bacterium]
MTTQGDNRIFALDIGTRSVVGLVAEHGEDGKLRVVATEAAEHTTRSMLDGQIHDVVEVADIIRRVKTKLEDRVGPLKKVAVAAAGRALKTVRTRVDRDLNNQRLSEDDVLTLELTAVQQAERQLQETTPDAARYHCVGYTVLHYLLDDSVIGSLVDQWGLIGSVEIIATFLPRVVIDSLQIALERADLEMAALTLEPIAAINALIPPTMRKLNLALVDIGAGTSDVALTAEGTVVAYGMVPVAGDEITEALSQKYLLDFPVAEQLKRELLLGDTVSFTDVLGIPYDLPSRDVIQSIHEEVTKLALQIAREIKNLNQRGPQAVMLVGGGSQTPMLPALLAAELGLPKERVVIRGTDAIQALAEQHETLFGPQAVTPVGIALAALHHPVSSVAIKVNGQTHRLFEFRQITVGDCLLAADVDVRKLHGRPGMALTVEVNGKMKVLRGTMGTPAQLLLNGKPGKLDDTVQHGDEIEVLGGTSGVDAAGTISDVLDSFTPLSVTFGGVRHVLPPVVLLNGQKATVDTPLRDRAKIETKQAASVRDVLTLLDAPLDLPEEDELSAFEVTIDNQTVRLPYDAFQLLVNGEAATPDAPMQDGDTLEYREVPPPVYHVRFFYDESLNAAKRITCIVNGKPITVEGPRPPIYRNGKRAALDDLVQHGDTLHLMLRPQESLAEEEQPWEPVLSDLFKYYQIENERPPHAINLVLTVDTAPASFNTPIHHGAVVTMEWV